MRNVEVKNGVSKVFIDGVLTEAHMPILNCDKGYRSEFKYTIEGFGAKKTLYSTVSTNFGGNAKNFVATGSQSELEEILDKLLEEA